MASHESWYFLEHDRRPPAWNMACDEWLLSRAEWLARPVLRTYAWDRPSVSIGYFQVFPENFPNVVRRPTGGALVVHDADLTFTVTLPPSHPWRRLGSVERYALIHERVARVFERRGVSSSLAMKGSNETTTLKRHRDPSLCFAQHSRYDVIVHGVKVAGGAQRVTREGLLHQGSIQGGDHWRVSSDELRLAWESFGARFTSLHLAADEEEVVSGLAASKYSTREWNHRVRA